MNAEIRKRGLEFKSRMSSTIFEIRRNNCKLKTSKYPLNNTDGVLNYNDFKYIKKNIRKPIYFGC